MTPMPRFHDAARTTDPTGGRLPGAARPRGHINSVLRPWGSTIWDVSTLPPEGQTRLVGRVAEVAEVRRLLGPGRVLTLTGIGGAGKTRIARRVIADSTVDYPSGVWVIELVDFVEPELLGECVAGALDLQVPPGAWDNAVLAGFFATRPGLLVLDNCEHLIDAVAELVSALLAQCPELTVLATSRMPLAIARETVLQIPPLSAPELDTPINLDDAPDYDSIVLYVDRARQAKASFQLTEENVAAVGTLVAQLDGIPLAIELAAARVRVLSPDSLLDRIYDRFEMLESDVRDVPARQRSLAGSVAWTYDLCTEDERELWCRLSVFVGGFELDTVEEVCAGSGITTAEVLGLLSTLVDLSVVGRVGETGSRFRMPETIRQYGVERLAESGATTFWRDRHLRWYSDLASRLERGWLGPDQLRWMDTLRAEHANIRAALEHGLSTPEMTVLVLRMCLSLEPLWICGGFMSEGRRWIDRAVEATDGAEAEKVAALHLCAWFAALQLDLDYAQERVDRAGKLAPDGDALSQGHYLYAAGVVASWKEDYAGAIELLTRSRDAYTEAGHQLGVLEAELSTGMAQVFSGDFEGAGSTCRGLLEVTDPLGETDIGAYARWVLGLGALMSGDLGRATTLEQDALARCASLGDKVAIAMSLEALAWICAVQQDYDRAVPLLGGADQLWQMVSMQGSLTPGIRDLRALGESQLRAATGDAAFEAAFARGLAMAPHEVVEFALAIDGPTAVAEPATAGPLSRRESEVAALIADGLSNRDIAERLFLSERTAQGHVQSILRKLGFNSRSQVAVWFIKQERSTTAGAETTRRP